MMMGEVRQEVLKSVGRGEVLTYSYRSDGKCKL